MRCAVCKCNSDNQSKKNPCDKTIKFYRFPKNSDLYKQWLNATKRKDKVNLKNAVICSKHFLESDYKVNLKHRLLNYTPKNYRGLKDDAVPSQNLPQSQVCSMPKQSTSKKHRELLAEKRKKAHLVSEVVASREP